MSIIDKKNKIFGKIAAAKLTTEDKFNKFKKKRIAKSLESINNTKGKIIGYLTDLITILVGYLAIVTTLVDTFTHELDKIEKQIKKALKIQLKSIVSCGVNPTIPDFLKSSGSGVTIQVKKVDFFDLFKTDPNSSSGKLIYQDVQPDPLTSNDFNTFLYGVIQNDGVAQNWKNILTIIFISKGEGTRPNNSLIINATPKYDSLTLTDLNNDFVDSITLFNTQGIINRLIDLIYGSISFDIKKSKKQLINEAKINTVIDKIVDSDANDIIDDNYFVFTNDETWEQEQIATLREQGLHKIELSTTINSSIPVNMLSDFNNEMEANGGNKITEKEIIANNLIAMANQTTAGNIPNVPPLPNIPNLPSMPSLDGLPDNVTIKLNFASELFKNFTKTVISSIISPKVITIFLLNLKIVYGLDIEYKDGVDFIKKNKNIFVTIIKGISTIIIGILLKIALKEISELVSKKILKKREEKAKQRREQTISLLGPTRQVLNNIKNK